MIIQKYPFLTIAGAVVLVVGLFVGLTADQSGFPLDDAWIHQTYARNLAQNGRWEYVPGVVSAGSTAPLWTLLLAVGYLVGLPYLLWAYFLGGVFLFWLGWSSIRLWCYLWPEAKDQAIWAGLAVVCTWPLVWAAASGMETLLFAALGSHILALYSSQLTINHSPFPPRSFALLGFLSGLLILTRPDGLILPLLILFGFLLTPSPKQPKVAHPFTRSPFHLQPKVAIIFLSATLLPLLPYFAFNLWSSGAIWPNTFYAKQVEYAVLLQEPLPFRLGRLLFFSLGGPESGWRGISGAHLLLLPGLITAVWQSAKRDWGAKRPLYLLPLLWAGGHIFLYAWRLPVTYQHGRYLLPVLPVWVVYGLAGWRLLLAALPVTERIGRLLRLTVNLTMVVLWLVFLFLGAQAYATDVAIIEGEMVTVAHWLAGNTPPDAVIAAHDIGAIGYFAERPLLDLAGLISPEIIPLLADESALSHYILQSRANYLVTAPGWTYTEVVLSAELLYSTDFALTREQGSNNMSVYRLR